jgi:hypothetical protein
VTGGYGYGEVEEEGDEEEGKEACRRRHLRWLDGDVPAPLGRRGNRVSVGVARMGDGYILVASQR